MQVINAEMLDHLAGAAASNARRRQHFNFHLNAEEPCQRLLSAMETDSYVRPHRHLTPLKPETFLALRGRFAVLEFDEEGALLQAVLIGPREVSLGVDIAAGTWHAVIALESGSVFFEAKPGPYRPLTDKDWAFWAPAEGTAEGPAYLERLRVAALALAAQPQRKER